MPRGNGQRTYQTEGIVLRGRDFGEADRLVTMLTPEYGKVRAVAKGVRRATSKKAGHIEPFSRLTALMAQGRDLDQITQVDTLDAFLPLREDLDRYGWACYLTELADRFSEEGTEHRAFYDNYHAALVALAHGAESDIVLRWFEMELLTLNGLAPSWARCAGCEKPVEAGVTYAFDLERGGLLCPECSASLARPLLVDTDAVKLLRLLAREPLARLVNLRVPPDALHTVAIVLGAALRGGLDSDLRTPGVLRRLQG